MKMLQYFVAMAELKPVKDQQGITKHVPSRTKNIVWQNVYLAELEFNQATRRYQLVVPTIPIRGLGANRNGVVPYRLGPNNQPKHVFYLLVVNSELNFSYSCRWFSDILYLKLETVSLDLVTFS